ncbi:hypothetical protein C0991_005858 [Blastosporella zonata]|nr:hypothetical protein C0991_005858 [Blastosporella zonata]
MPEDGEAQGKLIPAVIHNVHPPRSGKNHPSTTDSPRRRRRSHVPLKPANDARMLKRRKIIEEFYETERAYVDGLELIYSHFLTPIIASLDTPDPLLDRLSLTSIFSNFIDIWNLHRSFFSSLTSLLTTSGIPSSASTSSEHFDPPLPLSPILLSHFPYLSLYNPFVTSFPTTISGLADLVTPPSSTHANPKYSAAFATFLTKQESDTRCGKLKLRDWLLTIVQRCPRYLLLLKDLIGCTDEEEQEHAQLTAVHALVSKITLSLNTSLHTHAQTLSLLSLQRATPNLPFQLIVPGRILLKRGSLLQIERSGQPREREFLLFSDCFIWLAGEESERAHWKADWGISRSGWGAGYADSSHGFETTTPEPSTPSDRPAMENSQIKNEAELPLLKIPSRGAPEPDLQESSPTTPTKPTGRLGPRKSFHPPPSMISRRSGSSGGDERWVYKGRAELVDLEVIVTPPREDGEERRFEILSPEGSFVLYSGTEEDRDDWCSSIRQAKEQLLISLNVIHPNSTLTSSSSTNHLRRTLQALPFPPTDDRMATTVRASTSSGRSSKGKAKKDHEPSERRRKVEHWVPAIWIPDEKTSECPHQTFIKQTFFISDPNAKDGSSKPARACDACYETVFPLIDPVPGVPFDVTGTIHRKESDSFPSLSNMPSWLSMPSLPVTSTPQALMAIDREPSSPSSRLQGLPDFDQGENHRRVKARPIQHPRPKSYNHLLEEVEHDDHDRFDLLDLEEDDEGENGAQEGDDEGRPDPDRQPSSNGQTSMPSSPRKENTARRNKRFSLPAVALHTTNVTAHTNAPPGEADIFLAGDPSGSSPLKSNKRFSLVLGGRHHNSGMRSQSEAVTGSGLSTPGHGAALHNKSEIGQSIAVGKLSELLGRKTV